MVAVPLPHGYRWLVTYDRTGIFRGRYFRTIDLHCDFPDENDWPEGIVFQHIDNGERFTVQSGRLIKLPTVEIRN
jgi:hypothetical protein